MKRIFLFATAFCLSAWTGSSFGEDNRESTIQTAIIGVAPYRALYVQAGVAESLPAILVYAPSGRCVGTLDYSASARLHEAIEELISEPDTGCAPFLSTEFGATGPGESTGPGRVTVQLLVFAGDFCSACTELEEEFRTLATESQPDYDWLLTRVDLGIDYNPRVDTPEVDRAPRPTD